MRLTVLGCGTSTGVPLIHCGCRVCRSRDPRDRRLRCSAWVRAAGKSLLIDTSPDLREQALRARIPRLDAVLYTHAHADHSHGIDELRSFNYVQREPIPIHASRPTCEELERKFGYIFRPGRIEGGGIPLLKLHPFDAAAGRVSVAGVPVTPIPLLHGSRESVGYRIGRLAYVVDCSEIPEESLAALEGLSILFLDCVRLEPHGTHLNLDRALELAARIRAKRTFLTHLGHDFSFKGWSGRLPRGIALAHDGLTVRLGDP
jgi:phosphoribosyl 1,2-cyclic phosphate phosphodiesterase